MEGYGARLTMGGVVMGHDGVCRCEVDESLKCRLLRRSAYLGVSHEIDCTQSGNGYVDVHHLPSYLGHLRHCDSMHVREANLNRTQSM
jgi:hypothetical protein